MDSDRGFDRFTPQALRQLAEQSIGAPVVDRRGAPPGPRPKMMLAGSLSQPSALFWRAAELRNRAVKFPAPVYRLGASVPDFIAASLLHHLTNQDHDEWVDDFYIKCGSTALDEMIEVLQPAKGGPWNFVLKGDHLWVYPKVGHYRGAIASLVETFYREGY